MKRNYILHPFLFTTYAVLTPLATNISVVGLLAIRSLIISLFWVILLSIVFRLVLKNQDKAGLLLSGLIVLFFSYGYVDAFIAGYVSFDGLSSILILVYVLLFGFLANWTLKKSSSHANLTSYLNLVGLILVIFPLYSLLTYNCQSTRFEPLAMEYQQEMWQQSGVADMKAGQKSDGRSPPDIYYIILDGYTRADVLQELFGYDNSGFLQALETRGFYVAREAHSNYTDTVFTISSSLNLAHVNNLPDYLRPRMEVGDKETLQEVLSVLVEHNRARSFLAERGYEFVNFDSSYPQINIRSADYFENSPGIGIFNPQVAFDMMVLNTTFGKTYFDWRGEKTTPFEAYYDEHRTRILYILENLDKFAAREGSYFIYAHIISPHAPYVFGPNGEPRKGSDPFTLLEDIGNESWSPDLYRDQVIFINKKILAAIDQILLKSDTQPIIILQADHGNRTYNAIDLSDDIQLKLMFPIISAYYLPGYEKNSPVYPSISPVNTFRLIFNAYFGTRLSLLDDTSYVLTKKQGHLEFVEACLEFRTCLH